jgi:NAD(P)-dependent dehydrogenase (short-subunit alcohol dehydrogenase family)
MRFDGKVVMVANEAASVGCAIAQAFGSAGATVIVIGSMRRSI